MQIIRSSRECKWITDCHYCGCVFIYKGDEIEEAELPALPESAFAKSMKKVEEPEKRHICQVMCPECHKYVQVAMMAKYRKPAFSADDWEVDEYAGC